MAGYGPSPTPAGYLLVAGIYFERASRALARNCSKAAGDLGFAVPCPALIPTSYPGSAGMTCPSFGEPFSFLVARP